MKNQKTANINVKVKQFFSKWIEFTKPFHKLAKRHQDTLALLLYHHYRLGKEITNEKILWKEVFGYDTKVLISDELGIKMGAVENLYSQLRGMNIIVNNRITPAYVPELDTKSPKFSININFNINYNE